MHLDPCFLYQSGMTSTKTGTWSSFHVSPPLIPSFYVLKYIERLPWWLSSKESACQFRRHGFDLWSRKIPRAAEQPQLLSWCSRARELNCWAHTWQLLKPAYFRACAPQQEKPLQREAHTLQWRPSTAQKKKKKSTERYQSYKVSADSYQFQTVTALQPDKDRNWGQAF